MCREIEIQSSSSTIIRRTARQGRRNKKERKVIMIAAGKYNPLSLPMSTSNTIIVTRFLSATARKIGTIPASSRRYPYLYHHKSLASVAHRCWMRRTLPTLPTYFSARLPSSGFYHHHQQQQHRSSYRFLSSSSSSSSKPTNKRLNEKGGVFIYLGWTILGLVAVDQALQYKHEQDDQDRHRLLAEMQYEADNASMNVADWDETLPTLFTCTIVHIEPGLDGTKMLTRKQIKRKQNSNSNTTGSSGGGINRNIQTNDIVEILEANVGPNRAYHLCRWREVGQKKQQQQKMNEDASEATTSVYDAVGWYPIQYLKQID